ncbi:MAG: ABC transporter permease [Verrucomicrobiota bacterium]
MQAFLTLTRRELAGFFVSFTGYIIIAAAVFQMGLSFVILLNNLNGEPTPMPVTEIFYVTAFFWLILLLSAPVITMRLFALERHTGTFETLMTAPVGDLQVVLAKFFAALIFYMIMWLPLLGCIFIVQRFTHEQAGFDLGTAGSTYLGIFLVGCLYMALGCFASALTRSQIIAAMISLIIGVTFFLLSFLSEQINLGNGWGAQALGYIAMREHMRDFSRGIIDTRYVVFYLSLTIFFLFLTHRVVESRRWK